MLAACSERGEALDPAQKFEQTASVESPYEHEKALLPDLVHRLFYAVKDSLDYAVITGGIEGEIADMTPDSMPLTHLEAYERVDRQLLNELNKEYVIKRHIVAGWDYELIVENKLDPGKQFKATRMAMSYFVDGAWISIGPYIHW